MIRSDFDLSGDVVSLKSDVVVTIKNLLQPLFHIPAESLCKNRYRFILFAQILNPPLPYSLRFHCSIIRGRVDGPYVDGKEKPTGQVR